MTSSALEVNLLTLLRGKRLHGLGMIEAFQACKASLSAGSLYPTLHKLEKKGFVISAWDNERGHARRRYYTITPRGEEYLDNEEQQRHRLQRYQRPKKEEDRGQTLSDEFSTNRQR